MQINKLYTSSKLKVKTQISLHIHIVYYNCSLICNSIILNFLNISNNIIIHDVYIEMEDIVENSCICIMYRQNIKYYLGHNCPRNL